jgi:DNA-binding YbaB/EbfC family protein
MRDIGKMMQQVKELQSKMAEINAKLADAEIVGAAGGGTVKVTMNGKGELRRVKLDPALLKPEDAEILEDLLVAAMNDAKAKAEAHSQSEMAKLTAGLPLPPGMKLPF